MAHLLCYSHKRRSMVISNGDVFHRNGESCPDRIVTWGDKEFVSFDVPDKGALSSAGDWMKHIKVSVNMEDMEAGLHKMADQFKKMAAVITEGGKTIAAILPNPMQNRMAELVNAAFGDLDSVTRTTVLGHFVNVTSTSEGIEAHGTLTEVGAKALADDEAYREMLRRKSHNARMLSDFDKLPKGPELDLALEENAMLELCHCGKPATKTEHSPNMDSYCNDCTLVRCDAFPGACSEKKWADIETY